MYALILDILMHVLHVDIIDLLSIRVHDMDMFLKRVHDSIFYGHVTLTATYRASHSNRGSLSLSSEV